METHSIGLLGQIPVGDALEAQAWQALATRPLIAQQFEDNLSNNFQGAFNNFIESGQVWALMIGLLLGYLIRSVSAY